MNKEKSDLVEEIANEITETILSSRNYENLQKRNFAEIVKLKNRIKNLEQRLEKHINNYKITATEIERQITERTENSNQEIEKRIANLIGQIEDLRSAMIRLSNEIKKIKEEVNIK